MVSSTTLADPLHPPNMHHPPRLHAIPAPSPLQGEPTPPRTTRIFVARIPPSVTEPHFKSYFEAYGKLQDAYMPRDHSKQVGARVGRGVEGRRCASAAMADEATHYFEE